jgi:hypothetical protein
MEKAAVFRSTKGFLLTKERRFTECLREEIDAFFEPNGAVRERVMEICFGENVSSGVTSTNKLRRNNVFP